MVAHDPEGAANAKEMYGDKIEIAEDAYGAAEGAALAWLRLYFEEVVAPAAQVQRRLLNTFEQRAAQAGGACRILRLNGESPAGVQAWAASRVPQAVAFATRLRDEMYRS